MKDIFKGTIIGLIIGLLIGGAVTYVFFRNVPRPFQLGNFEIDDSTKQEIVNFFDGAKNQSEIDIYCSQNRMYCIYYCREINAQNQYCNAIQNFSRQNGRDFNQN